MIKKKRVAIASSVALASMLTFSVISPVSVLDVKARTIFMYEQFANLTTADSSEITQQFNVFANADGTVSITGYNGTEKDIVIPATINGKLVKKIEDGAFKNKSLTSVVIGNGIKEIGSNAFEGNTLTAVIIPTSVNVIGSFAFANNKLTSVTIPSSVTQLGTGVFMNNEIKTFTLPNTLTVIPERLFENNKIVYVDVNSRITSIEDGAFADNDIETLDIKSGLKLIGNNAFYNNKIKSLYLPESVASVGDNAFKGNPIKSVTIPKILSSILKQFTNNASSLDSLYLYEKGKDPGYDSGTYGSLNGQTEHKVVVKLGLEAGDLTLVKPELARTSFGTIKLDKERIEENIQFTSDLYVSDTRGTNDGWTLTVKATPFKEVPKKGGTAPTGGWFELPEGTLSLAGIDAVYKVDSNGNRVNVGTTGVNYEKEDNIVIDSGEVELVSVDGRNSFGVWAIKFDSAGLVLNLEPNNRMIDNKNYDDEPTPYISTITWTLVSGPGKK